MVIYKIYYDKKRYDKEEITADTPHHKFLKVDASGFASLPIDEEMVDPSFILEHYQLQLSREEIAFAWYHLETIKRFVSEENDEICLIIEDNVQLLSSPDTIADYIDNVQETWEVFCPFDKTDQPTPDPPEPYLMGKYWGAYAYFLTRSGAGKLAALEKIRHGIDEEMIVKYMEGSLQVRYADTALFSFSEPLFLQYKKKAIQRSVLNLNVWSTAEKTMIRKILGELSRVAAETGIPIILDGGTLLGSIRHAGIIPWDDDVDLAIEEGNLARFLDHVGKTTSLQFDMFEWERSGTMYYKFWLPDGEAIEGHPHLFPFADLWIFYARKDEVVFRNGRRFNRDQYFPLKKSVFENSVFYVPGKSVECLDKQYWDWKEMVRIYHWSHRKEKIAFFPLTTPITVDQNGLLIPD